MILYNEYLYMYTCINSNIIQMRTKKHGNTVKNDGINILD